MIFLILCAMFFLSSPTLMNFWASLLFSTLFISMKMSSECKISGMKYFIFQELSTWLVLMSLVSGLVYLTPFMMVFKMGLPPLHGWLIPIVKKLDYSIKLLLVSSKILPMTTSLSLFYSLVLPLIVMTSSFIFFTNTISMKEIFIMSSGYNLSWSFLTSSEMYMFSFMYVLMYLVFLEIFIDFRKTESPNKVLEYSMVLGLPPSGFFFMKMIMVNYYSLQFILLTIMLLGLLFLLLNYLKLLENLSYSKNLYKSTISDKGLWFSLFMLPVAFLCI